MTVDDLFANVEQAARLARPLVAEFRLSIIGPDRLICLQLTDPGQNPPARVSRLVPLFDVEQANFNLLASHVKSAKQALGWRDDIIAQEGEK